VLTLRTFGECRIDVARADGPPLALAPSAARLFSLALLLAGEAGRRVPRERAAAWLWPELDAARARRCLRQALYRLRGAGVPVEATADHLRLAPDAVAATFAARPDPARLGDVRDGAEVRVGRCLPGWSPEAAPFREWVDAYRARQEGAARAALRAATAAAAGDAAAAIARALLELDPGDAGAAREASAAAGRTSDAATQRASPALPLVGRAALVAALTARLRDACAGRGGALQVEGAPGAGTSRLLDALAGVAGQLGAVVVRADRRSIPLDACRAVVARLLERPGALGTAPAALLRLRRFAAGRDGAAGPAADRLLSARVAELAGAVSDERPLVIALDEVGDGGGDDDAGGDARSVAVLAAAAAAARGPVLVAWTVHPRRAGGGAPGAGVERLAVPPLAPSDVAALARAAAAAGRRPLTDDDVRWCAEAGRGLPREVIALARQCADAPGTRTAPPAMAARHAADFGRLSAAERRALQAAALLGAHATAARVASTWPDARRGRRAVAALLGAGVLRATASGVVAAHPFTADAALHALRPGDRRALHAAAAGALANDARAAVPAGADVADAALAAAAHWWAAGAPTRATAFLADLRAALLAAGRSGDAVALLRRALDAARGAADGGDGRGRGAGGRPDVGEVAALVAGTLFAAGDARGAAALARGGPAGAALAGAAGRDAGELTAIASAWRAGRAWAPLLARARRLATDACAATAARLEAAALAAALADNGAAGPLGGALPPSAPPSTRSSTGPTRRRRWRCARR
jgi:DNA-binding SARP family transcriptional activator